jgi:sterol 3beta-glucosyltransferase
MTGRNPKALADLAIEALTRAGARGILATGWGGLKPDALPPGIIAIDQAPHSWLFPRMAAVVHHGGAGTTAAGLRAGRPSVVVPFFGDQPFWGRQIHDMGAGSTPIPRKKLTPSALSAAICQVMSSPSIQQTAKDLGKKICQEDGIARAVRIIETMKNQT